MKKQLMNAIVATGYGSADVLTFTQVERPAPKAKEVLVKVHAASATRAESMMLTGKPYIGRLFMGLNKPKHEIPGTGFAGEIAAIGEEVTKFQIGEAVFGLTTTHFSTNAEYVTVPEDGVILPKPEILGFSEAATLGDGPLTSMNFLKELAQIQAGEKVLINGASGSLGSAAVQLAVYYGAEVTGVSSTKNLGMVKSLGAHYVIDYTKEDFTQSEVHYDIIYDTIGKSSFRKSKRVLKEGGQYISPVLKFSLLLQMLWTSFGARKKAKFAASGLKKEDELRSLSSQLLEIIRAGKLKIVIDRQFPLEKVAEAYRYIATGHKKGNVVIKVH